MRNAHSSREERRVGLGGEILRCLVGSGVHGTAMGGQDDRDEMGICMVRLGVQGVELLRTGRITLPLAEPWLSWCRALRRGEHSRREALEVAADLERQLVELRETSPLPQRPDRTAVDAWLVDAHQRAWAGQLPARPIGQAS